MSSTTKRPMTLEEATRPVAGVRDAKDEAWHDEETRKALNEADAGDFATAAEVRATVRKFLKHG